MSSSAEMNCWVIADLDESTDEPIATLIRLGRPVVGDLIGLSNRGMYRVDTVVVNAGEEGSEVNCRWGVGVTRDPCQPPSGGVEEYLAKRLAREVRGMMQRVVSEALEDGCSIDLETLRSTLAKLIVEPADPGAKRDEQNVRWSVPLVPEGEAPSTTSN